MCDELLQKLIESANEARELYVPKEVPRHHGCPKPLEFHRNFVATNLPCLFTNVIDHWPALERWTDDCYLERVMGNQPITVTATSNGLADAVVDGKFLLPEERKMTMKDFIALLNTKSQDSVFYIQKQNSNLSEEFKPLNGDVDEDIGWATEALGLKPDAVNLWIGQKEAVTSLHKDHYENLYVVVRGKKTFTLLPPSDRPFIPYHTFPVAKQRFFNGQWTVEDTEEKVPWIPLNPLNPNLDRYPRYAQAQPIVVEVQAGEMLYLPSMWYHHVQQADHTIAVNYWYDMQFDIKYNFHRTLDSLSKLLDNSS